MNHNTANCPVCGMQVHNDEYVTDYQKMRISFCSRQCYDSFNTHPRLYLGQMERREPRLKHRILSLQHSPVPAKVTDIRECLQGVMGVREVDVEGVRLHITYDLLQVTQSTIEQVLLVAGIELHSGWLQRLNRGRVHYLEETELDNLGQGERACCNRPPPRA